MRAATPALAVALCALAGCVSTAVPEPAFVNVYAGSAASAEIKLEMLRQLPKLPESGWLNAVDLSLADARLRAMSRKPVKFELTPNFVAFQAEPEGKFPGAKYRWQNGALVVCMLRMIPIAGKSDTLALASDYSQCATMELASR